MGYKKKIKQKLRVLLGDSEKSNEVKLENVEFTDASKLLEHGYGHLLSRKSAQAVDKNGNPIPWFTYPAIEYLSQLDLSDKIMLEWGAGSSSLFFSKKVARLFSIESDLKWFEKTQKQQSSNQTLVLAVDDYADKALTFDQEFDIILIDGIDRHDCAEIALKVLGPKGIIILDNSDRYPDISKEYRKKGYLQIDFHGFGPINNYTWTTTIFFDRSVDLNPIGRQPRIPIGGGY